MSGKRYDLIVIGGGSAGGTAAKAAAREGRSVALVEKDRLGGTCLNAGCDPTKALLHVATLAQDIRGAKRFGIHTPPPRIVWEDTRQFVNGLIDSIRGGSHEDAVARQENRGIDVYLESARFLAADTVEAGGHTLHSDRIVIGAGKKPREPDIDGLAECGYWTNRDAVKIDALPESLLVLGAGPQGCEVAQLFSRLGVEVTVVHFDCHVLPREDADLAIRLKACLEREGIRFVEQAEATRATRLNASRLRLEWKHQDTGAPGGAEAEALLVAAGREPDLDGLALYAAGVALEDGLIKVDETLRTTTPGIWAAGDAASIYAFTHVASEQGLLAARNAFADEPEPYRPKAIPWVTFTEPSLASVGKTEAALGEEGISYRVHRLDVKKVIRNRLEGRTDGLLKIIEGDKGEVLGAQFLAHAAGELIAPVVLAMEHGLTVEQIQHTVLPYPTFAEGVRWTAASAAE